MEGILGEELELRSNFFDTSRWQLNSKWRLAGTCRLVFERHVHKRTKKPKHDWRDVAIRQAECNLSVRVKFIKWLHWILQTNVCSKKSVEILPCLCGRTSACTFFLQKCESIYRFFLQRGFLSFTKLRRHVPLVMGCMCFGRNRRTASFLIDWWLWNFLTSHLFWAEGLSYEENSFLRWSAKMKFLLSCGVFMSSLSFSFTYVTLFHSIFSFLSLPLLLIDMIVKCSSTFLRIFQQLWTINSVAFFRLSF